MAVSSVMPVAPVPAATPLLTSRQAADHLAISTRSLSRLKAAGVLRFSLVGASVRYRLSTLEQYAADQERADAA